MNWGEFIHIFEGCELAGNKIILKSNLHDIVDFVVEKYQYDMLKEIIGNDTGDGIELIYHLYSTIDEEDLFLSIVVQNEIESVIDIFESAVADEKEIYDMFGIKFINHEDLKRLYMPENWEGFPLRKDYIESDTRLAWNEEN